MSTKKIKDYYGILGVEPYATQDEIRLAYRRMARARHPDVNTASNADAQFRELNEAYEVLADPAKRNVYDSLTREAEAASETAPNAATNTSPPTVTPGRPSAAAAPSGTTRTRSRAPKPRSQRLSPPTWAILLIMLGVLIIIGVGVGALLSMRQQRPTGGADTADVGKLATFKSPPTISPGQSVLQEDGTPLSPILPNQLDVSNKTFSVVPVTPDEGRWPIPEQPLDVAVWVHGTVVNYVVGLPYTPTTESLLAGLGSGERITMTLDNGVALVFGAPQAQRIAADDLTPMSQQQPGLTLVLLGGTQTNRLVVRARYLPEESFSSEGQQRVDGLLVDVIKSGVVREAGDTRHFVVEYKVTNQTDMAVNPSFFDLILESGTGQSYTVNAEVTAEGEAGALQTAIPSGASVQGSAGYLLPRDIAAPLTWVFRADPSSANMIRNVLPYEAPLPSPPQPVVELTSAFADGRRNTVVINGSVRNAGETALTVTLDDVSLSSAQGNSSLQASTPLLPWSIAPGASQDFEVQFSRPAGVDSLLFDILGFSFQVEGLP